jgi:hypothetical protein
MFGSAKGGNDSLIGGNNSGSGDVVNNFFGDAAALNGFTTGGNDTLHGGTAAPGGTVSNNMQGDGRIADSAKGGNDTLFAGTAAPGGTVINDMWGDGRSSGPVQGGADLFVFEDNGQMTVGTHNTIEDFSQSQHDKIEFSGVASVQSFMDLIITYSGTNAIITAGADQVTLANFTNSLTASDFVFHRTPPPIHS